MAIKTHQLLVRFSRRLLILILAVSFVMGLVFYWSEKQLLYFYLVFFITCAVISGESLYLWISQNFVIKINPGWICFKNNAFCMTDILSAFLLLGLAWYKNWMLPVFPFSLLLLFLLLSHGYREAEIILKKRRKFYFNQALSFFSLLRLTGLISLLFLIFNIKG